MILEKDIPVEISAVKVKPGELAWGESNRSIAKGSIIVDGEVTMTDGTDRYKSMVELARRHVRREIINKIYGDVHQLGRDALLQMHECMDFDRAADWNTLRSTLEKIMGAGIDA